MKRWLLRGAVLAAAALALAVTVVIVLAVRDREPSTSPPPPAVTGPEQSVLTRVKGVTENCTTRSEADFGPAFSDPGNLVVGPLAMVGGAEFTPASVVRRVRGQKYPLLVKAGHSVTIEVRPSARRFAKLGYGPLPQGEITLSVAHARVTFIACGRGERSGSSAGGPVTFWSGSIVADAPLCVPLDVFVDDEATARRVFIPLGVSCPHAA